jgi:hypothetical protein
MPSETDRLKAMVNPTGNARQIVGSSDSPLEALIG